MQNKCIILIITIVCFFLQCTAIQHLAIGSIVPNLLLVLIVSMGLIRGKNTALSVGFILGLLTDLLFGSYLGIHAFWYMLVGYLSGFSHSVYYDNNIKVPMFMAAVGDLIYNLGIYICLFLLQGRVDFGYYFERIMIPEMIYTVFITAIFYKLFYHISHRLMKQDRKEGNSLWLLK